MSPKTSLLLLTFFLLLATPTLAALPPLDEAERGREATDIFEGRIEAIYTREERLDEDSTNTEMVLEIEVRGGSKGDLKSGDVIFVRCWIVGEREEGWVGDGGQRPVPRAGDGGTFYAERHSNGVYRLLHPNGWDPD